jgi:chitinase
VRHLLAIVIALAGCVDTLDASDLGAGSAAPPAAPIEYSPYFYTWGWGSGAYAFPSLVGMHQLGGPNDVTLGFVTSAGGCALTTDIHDNLADVRAFVAAGGHVRASFGGENGTYVESACTDATQLASALASFVDDTGITDLDFDIEQGSATSNPQINAVRAYAIRSVQDSHGIRASFTLPVGRTGLDDLGVGVLQAAQTYGVTISYVNVMTMDYGSGNDLATWPEGSIDATAAQLGTLYGISRADAYRLVGATAMIGDNDDPETFSLADAQTLATYARQRQLGLLSFWAIQRDQPCAGAVDIDTCNGVGTSTFQFHDVLSAVAR